MKGSLFSEEQIIGILREHEAGAKVPSRDRPLDHRYELIGDRNRTKSSTEDGGGRGLPHSGKKMREDGLYFKQIW
jgi:hypothetical protein